MANLIATDYYDVIVGFGSTGQSVARYFERTGVNFCVADTRNNVEISNRFEKQFPGRKLFLGPLDKDLLLGCRRIILSPGISRKENAIRDAINKGVNVVGDVHLFLDVAQSPTIGITGSNGKTTVTTLMGNIAKRAGLKVAVGGNIGVPALDLLDIDAELTVLELSSFQLESIAKPNLTVACILNITPDHMDRYDSLQEYCMSKQKIYWGAKNIVVNRDDVLTIPPMAENTKYASFGSVSKELLGTTNYWFNAEEGWIYKARDRYLARSQIKMVGDHNVANAMAVMAIAELAGIESTYVFAELAEFSGLDHRCQWVENIAGVTFINDSKGTNVGATIAAIEGLKNQFYSLVLIAGGDGKNANFEALGKSIERNVASLITLGVDGDQIAKAVHSSKVAKQRAEDMSSAVAMAFEQATSGGAVLLSPACASFDMFSGYEARGACFVEAVKELCP